MKKILFLLIVTLFYFGCSKETQKIYTDLLRIELKGDLAERTLEASGLTWYKENLIVLPQFPHKWDEQFDGVIYYIPKERINSYISGENRNPIMGEKIYFTADGLDEVGKRRGSGYEAITFIGDTVYVSIESISGDESASYIVKGKIDFEKKKIVLDANSKVVIKSQTGIHNMGEETIFEFKNSVYAIHEANGKNINKAPFVTKLGSSLVDEDKIFFPNIEYRITDATQVDSTGKFYAINYFYPGEFKKLKPNLSEKEKDNAIEQILEFQIFDGKIVRTDRDPIKLLNRVSKKGHNWEGIVKQNDGFLIITDMFPETILAFLK